MGLGTLTWSTTCWQSAPLVAWYVAWLALAVGPGAGGKMVSDKALITDSIMVTSAASGNGAGSKQQICSLSGRETKAGSARREHNTFSMPHQSPVSCCVSCGWVYFHTTAWQLTTLDSSVWLRSQLPNPQGLLGAQDQQCMAILPGWPDMDARAVFGCPLSLHHLPSLD